MVPTADRTPIQELTYLNPVQWGGSAAAVVIDIQAAEGCDLPAAPGSEDGQFLSISAEDTCNNDRWQRAPRSVQMINLTVLWLSVVALLGLAGGSAAWSLGRPERR